MKRDVRANTSLKIIKRVVHVKGNFTYYNQKEIKYELNDSQMKRK